MRNFLLGVLILLFIVLSSQWQASFNLLAESQLSLLTTDWEEITLSKSAEPAEVITANFERFLQENINGEFSRATLEWLSLAPRESAYQLSLIHI